MTIADEPGAARHQPTAMEICRPLLTVVAALLAFVIAPACGTDTHEYARGEYAIIRDGLSPDKRMSLASHGDGLGGNDNFHVWLMSEPRHRKIVSLDDIGSSNNLDTGPDAYHAVWTVDSRRVAVYFRSDRHAMELNLYNIDGRRVRLISGPSLFRDVTSRDVGRQDDLRRSESEIEWRGSKRFVLREYRLFLTSDPSFVRTLGAYGKVTDKIDDGRQFVEFSAEADCMLMPGDRYRIVDLRATKFKE
jgi:hypothetical protein